jgi:hypothetical protein
MQVLGYNVALVVFVNCVLLDIDDKVDTLWLFQ